MDSLFLSEHQFAQISSYMDTLILTVHDASPLDPAAPLSASRLIGEELGQRMTNRFRGRSALKAIGESIFVPVSSIDHLSLTKEAMPYEVSYGIVIVDRTLLAPKQVVDEQMVDGNPTTWLLFDWWQWVRERVPESRWSDAWMYLSLACPIYCQSEACEKIGLPEDVRQGMMQEGDKLFRTMEQELAGDLVYLWGTANRAPSFSREV